MRGDTSAVVAECFWHENCLNWELCLTFWDSDSYPTHISSAYGCHPHSRMNFRHYIYFVFLYDNYLLNTELQEIWIATKPTNSSAINLACKPFAVMLPTISIQHREGEAWLLGKRAWDWRKDRKGTFKKGRSQLLAEPRGWFCRNWYSTDVPPPIFPFSHKVFSIFSCSGSSPVCSVGMIGYLATEIKVRLLY